MSKEEYNFDDYKFVKVVLPFFYNGSKGYRVKGNWVLLVDNFCRIHGFKTTFSEVYITTEMQGLCWRNDDTRSPFNFWKNIVIGIGEKPVKRAPNDRRAKRRVQLNQKQLDNLNNYFNNYQDIYKINTFRNVELVTFLATHPRGSSGLKTLINNHEYVLSQFLQIFNIGPTHYYEKYFDYEIEKITFDKWVSESRVLNPGHVGQNNTLFEWLKSLNAEVSSDARSSLLNHWKKKVKNQNANIDQIDLDAKSERRKLDKKIKNIYGTIQKYAQTLWKTNIVYPSLEQAHIKGVAAIKKELLLFKNKKEKYKSKLEEISDPDNCLPLTPNLHKFFDTKKIYWNEDGQVSKNNLGQEFQEEIKRFAKINPDFLTQKRINYLIESKK